jgi:hypothetical protein
MLMMAPSERDCTPSSPVFNWRLTVLGLFRPANAINPAGYLNVLR